MTNHQLTTIGKTLASYRKAQGMTQADVAKLTNIDRPVVSAIERGRFTGSLRTLMRYLQLARYELTIAPRPSEYPTLEELSARYGEDDD